jgi:hypothetical protein
MEAAQQTTTTMQAHPRELQWDTGYGVGYSGHHEGKVTILLTITSSLASELEPPHLLGTLIGTLLWSGTSVIGLTRLSARWKGSDESSDGWMASLVTSGPA